MMPTPGCLSEYFSQLSKSCSCEDMNLERDDALVPTTSMSKSSSTESLSMAPSTTSSSRSSILRKKRRDGQRISWASTPVNRWGDESSSQMARLPRSSSYDDALEIAAQQKRDGRQRSSHHGQLNTTTTMPNRSLQATATQAKHNSLDCLGLPALPKRRSAHQTSDNSIGSTGSANFQWSTTTTSSSSSVKSISTSGIPKKNPLLQDLDLSRNKKSNSNSNISLSLSSKNMNTNPLLLASLMRHEEQESTLSKSLIKEASPSSTPQRQDGVQKEAVTILSTNSNDAKLEEQEAESLSPKPVRPLYQDEDEEDDSLFEQGPLSPLRLHATEAEPGAPRLPSRRASIDIIDDIGFPDTTETEETTSTEENILETPPSCQ